MFKKFFVTFILCMGIFGITAFADVQERALGLDGNTYYLSYTLDGSKEILTFNESTSTNVVPVFNEYLFDKKKGEYVFNRTGGPLTVISVLNDVSTNCPSLFEALKSKGLVGSEVSVPPILAPGLEEVQEIPTQLLGQLKILLPVGLLILSIMLGVSLVPRLVHLFL